MGNSSPKGELIPHVVLPLMRRILKLGNGNILASEEELAAYQLVGGVMAHQGKDG